MPGPRAMPGPQGPVGRSRVPGPEPYPRVAVTGGAPGVGQPEVGAKDHEHVTYVRTGRAPARPAGRAEAGLHRARPQLRAGYRRVKALPPGGRGGVTGPSRP